MYDTGYRKALCLLTVCDKEELTKTLRDYHTLIKTKAEMDQLCEGLESLNVLENIRKYSSLMKPLFVAQPTVLDKGMCTLLCVSYGQVCVHFYVLAMDMYVYTFIC